VLSDTASGLGWRVDTVASGEGAIEAVHQIRDTPYDVLLLDWRMPGMDGLRAAATIRERYAHESEAPIIIMVTAMEREQLSGQPGSEAVDMVLTKPVTGSSLYNCVLQAKLQRGKLGSQEQIRPKRSRLNGLRVLVVDDSDVNQEVAERILQGEGAEVQVASNGQEALDILTRSVPPARGFDAVLMDVQMPLMDGHATTQALRRIPALSQLPVVALTAGAFKSHQDAAMASGMNAYIAKPFDVDELVELLVHLCEPLVPASQTTSVQADASKTLGQTIGTMVEWDEGSASAQVLGKAMGARPNASSPQQDDGTGEPHADNAMALASRAQQQRLIDDVRIARTWQQLADYIPCVRRFVQTHQDDGRRMTSAFQEQDLAQVAALAHKLSGTAGSAALPRVSLLARAVELGAQQGQDLSGLLTMLTQALTQSCQEIASRYGTPFMTVAAGPEERELPSRSAALGALADVARTSSPALRDQLLRLLLVLDSDDPSIIEPELPGLRTLLPAATVQSLSEAVESFDFRAAEALVRRFASAQGLVLPAPSALPHETVTRRPS